MTAYGTPESAQMAIKSGAFATLTTPFSLDDLLAVVGK